MATEAYCVKCPHQERDEGRKGRHDEERQARDSGHLSGVQHEDVQDRQEQVDSRAAGEPATFRESSFLGPAPGGRRPRRLSPAHRAAWDRPAV